MRDDARAIGGEGSHMTRDALADHERSMAMCSLLGTPVEEGIAESMPLMASVLVLVTFLAFFPQVVLFPPNLVM